MAADCVPYFEPGDQVSVRVTAAVVARRFAKVSAARVNEQISAAHAGAGERPIGVVVRDQAVVGGLTGLVTEGIVPITAGEAITAGQEVQAGAAGVAMVLAAGKAAGVACDDIANGADGPIKLNV